MNPVVLELPKTKKTRRDRERAIIHAIEDRHHAVFYDVGYQTYERVLEKYPDRKNPRLLYDRGTLEIMPLSPFHETSERLLDLIFELIAEELELEDYINYGSTTQKRERLERGIESDSSFYIGAKAGLMRNKEKVLESDPSPDLVFEVDATHSSINKIPLLAALGITEIWQVEKKKLKILVLGEGKYAESGQSVILPGLTRAALNEFIADSGKLSRPEWRRKVREWARENLSK